MRGGKLRHFVTIEQRSSSRDGFGQQLDSWTTHASLYAAIVPLTGRELQAAQAMHSEVSHRVEIRYLATVTATMRVKHGTRYLNVLAVLNIEERDREMHLLCSEGLKNG